MAQTLAALSSFLDKTDIHGWYAQYRRPILRGSPPHRCAASRGESISREAPWQIAEYYTKKTQRSMDGLGNILDTPETTAESFAWTPDTKLELAAIVLAPQLGVDDPALLIDAVRQLAAIFPGGTDVLDRMKLATQVRLAAELETVPLRLVALRQVLPLSVDITKLIMQWPEVLFFPIQDVRAGFEYIVEVFQSEIGEGGVAAIITTSPQLLDRSILRACLRGAGHLMPLSELARSLMHHDNYWMQFQSLDGEPRNDYDELLKDVNYYLSDAVKPDYEF